MATRRNPVNGYLFANNDQNVNDVPFFSNGVPASQALDKDDDYLIINRVYVSCNANQGIIVGSGNVDNPGVLEQTHFRVVRQADVVIQLPIDNLILPGKNIIRVEAQSNGRWSISFSGFLVRT